MAFGGGPGVESRSRQLVHLPVMGWFVVDLRERGLLEY